MTSTLIGNGTVVTAFPGTPGCIPTIVSGGAIVVGGEGIVAVGSEIALREAYPDAIFADACGGIIAPGLVNAHHHFYSALARGLDPGRPMRNFAEVLDVLWWRLDRALDEDAARISAELSVADCIRWGCTTVFDHHASPSCIEGILDVIGGVVEDEGLRALLCYEITDRNGHDEALRGIEENIRFIEAHHGHRRVRGIPGLHASFTVKDETLGALVERIGAEQGCHVHVAEDPVDVSESRSAFGKTPVERLDDFGLLNDRCLMAHGIHLTDVAYDLAAGRDSVIIHNPESNANNRVGRLDVPGVAGRGVTVGLGTDGMSSGMLRALKAAFLAARDGSDLPASGFDAVPDLLGANAGIARRFFDEPLLGELTPGAPADVIVLDAGETTPMSDENLTGQLIFGMTEARVRHTVARGRFLLKDFQFTEIDAGELTARARQASPALWQRFHSLLPGTAFLG